MLWNYTYDTVSPIDLNKVENVDTGLPLFPYFFFTVVEKYRILIFQINTGFLCLTNSFKLYAMLMIIYILPQLLSLLVNAFEGDTQERERRLIEKPLRVENSLQKITAFS